MILTLTTDFGTRDGYVAQMKGVILGINPRATLVDVTHDIEPFCVLEAAFVVRGIAPYYPAGTVHVAVVDPGVGSCRRGIVVKTGEGLFVGPDNGVFSFVLAGAPPPASARQEIPCSGHLCALVPTVDRLDDCPTRKTASGYAQPFTRIWEIRNAQWMRQEVHPTFHGRDVYAPVAARLSLGEDPTLVGPEIHDPVTLTIPPVKRTFHGLDGSVIYVDRFGNLCTNIASTMLDRTVHAIRAGDTVIQGISRYFGEVAQGEPLALINSFGFLELAVNQGSAATILGLGIDSPVMVTWVRREPGPEKTHPS